MSDLGDRFWSKVDKSGGPDACWPWTGARHSTESRQAYGIYGLGGKTRRSHRLAFLDVGGILGPNQKALHRCDNPSCCNPAHIFGGTQAENMKDMQRKGRAVGGFTIRPPRGELNFNAKLNMTQANEIRERYRVGTTQIQLAKSFGVHQTLISLIVRNRVWVHIKETR